MNYSDFLLNAQLISPLVGVGFMVASFFVPWLKPKNFRRPLINLACGVIIVALPLGLYLLTNASADAGLGLLLYLAVLTIGFFAVLALFGGQIVMAYRHEKVLTLPGSQPAAAKRAWTTLAVGVVGAYALVQLGILLIDGANSFIHPYGVGRTKNDQFAGIYTSVNINGNLESRLSLSIVDLLANPKKYNGVDLCVPGRLEKNNSVYILRSLSDDPLNLSKARQIYIPDTGALTSMVCPSGTQCAAGATVCGHFDVANRPQYGSPATFLMQITSTNVLETGSESDQISWVYPYLQRTRPDGAPITTSTANAPARVADVLTDAQYLLGSTVCVKGVYQDFSDGTTPLVYDDWLLSIGLNNATSKSIVAAYTTLDPKNISSICGKHPASGAKCEGPVKICGILDKARSTTAIPEYPYAITAKDYSVVTQSP